MILGLITLVVDGFSIHLRLVSDHQVEIEISGTTKLYKHYGEIPLSVRKALDSSGRASAVEHHLTCSVS